ncbi:alpha/beta hydrolase [Sphingomonas limnosediminicola]|uniref:Alpha/beta hydrolase n=1 Tax=Sphingomonas limnosediminicola TaxID=940133 RepID=A0ABP7LU87_9SPHN
MDFTFVTTRLCVALVCGFILAGAATAQPGSEASQVPIQIGSSYSLQSKTLHELRTVNVVLPASYSKDPLRRYPVLYLLDGGLDQDLLHVAGVVQLGAMWGRSAEAIVVGLETKDRRKELVGPTADPELVKRYPTAGSSAKFREFIRKEVKPLIERTYRGDGHDVVLGESLAGLFVTETYLVEPSLFDGYAAVDPSLWWDKESLSNSAAAKLNGRQKGHRLMLAAAKEQLDDAAAIKRLVSLLKQRGLTYCTMARPNLTHATIYQQLTPQAVQYLLPPLAPPPIGYGFNLNCSDR